MGSMPAPQAQSIQYSGRIRTPEERAMARMQLQDYKRNRALALGIREGDPAALREFYGMQANATPEQYQLMRNRVRNEISPELYSILNTPHTTDAWTKAQEAKQAQSAGMAGTMGVNNPYTPQAKAKGGIMQVRKFAKGGLSSSQKDFVKQMAKQIKAGKEITTEQQARLNKIEESTGINVSPYSQVGTQTPGDPAIASAATALQGYFSQSGGNKPAEGTGQDPNKPFTPSDLAVKTPGMGLVDVIDPTTGKPTGGKNIAYTDPAAIAATNAIMNNQIPTQFGQAGTMFEQTYQGLGGLTNYTPQQVSAQQAAAQQAAAERATASQMGAIKDVSADRVNLGQYNINAAQMQRPEDVKAREIQAQNILGAQMQRPEDVQAQALQRYQMDATAPISTQDLEAFQMAGPGSWTDEGVSSKYMSPYMQGVIDISKREAERDYTKQMNALAAKAKSAGAFGGARQALERSEAQRNFNQQLQDIQTKGLQSAYESGRSQYGQELSLSQQAALQNLQSKLSTQSQSSQQALQAMLSNQNIDYQTKLQNLQAMLGVQSQEAQQMLNASLANQQAGLTTNQQNLQAEMQKQLANQQAGMTSQQANQQAFLQAALANQQSGLTAGQINAQLAQQAALANQGVGVQGDLANQQAALQAALANQQTQFGVGSLNANLANQAALQNAQLGTQASLTNAQLGTQTNLANAQNALQAGMANQQAGIAGAGINLNAFNAQQNAAQGIMGIGQANAGWNQQQITNLGNLANTNLTYGGNIAAKNAANAYNALYGYAQGTPASAGGGGNINYQQAGAV